MGNDRKTSTGKSRSRPATIILHGTPPAGIIEFPPPFPCRIPFSAPMKLALLGTDPDTLALVEAALAAGHQVVWLGDVRSEDLTAESADAAAGRLGRIGNRSWTIVWRTRCSWAAARPTKRCEPSSSSGSWPISCPSWRCIPWVRPVLVYYELDMARHEVHGVLRHYSPSGRLARGGTSSAEWVQSGDGPIGVVHQIVVQRSLADCRSRVGGPTPGPRRRSAADRGRRRADGERDRTARGRRFLCLAANPDDLSRAGHFALVGRADDRSESHAALTLLANSGTARLQLDCRRSDDHDVRSARGGARWPCRHTTPPAEAIAAIAAALPAAGTERSEAASTWQRPPPRWKWSTRSS